MYSRYDMAVDCAQRQGVSVVSLDARLAFAPELSARETEGEGRRKVAIHVQVQTHPRGVRHQEKPRLGSQVEAPSKPGGSDTSDERQSKIQLNYWNIAFEK